MGIHYLQTLRTTLIQSWYKPRPWRVLLPFSWLFSRLVLLRRYLYQISLFKSHRFAVPIIVVGNITVGGTGKTPCVIALVTYLREQGWRPGVVSRGYGGRCNKKPYYVQVDDTPSDVGDEPLLIKQRCQCPVVIARNRVAAVDTLLKGSGCDIVISDDGLQHYPLARSIELVMVDPVRGFGNQTCLPAGPLREPITRLQHTAAIIVTGEQPLQWQCPSTLTIPPIYSMSLKTMPCYALNQPSRCQSLADFSGEHIEAVAGIGHPERFFTLLTQSDIHCRQHAFADHHAFSETDFADFAENTILLTEKDAVKCRRFNLPNAWVVPIQSDLPLELTDLIRDQLTSVLDKCKKV